MRIHAHFRPTNFRGWRRVVVEALCPKLLALCPLPKTSLTTSLELLERLLSVHEAKSLHITVVDP